MEALEILPGLKPGKTSTFDVSEWKQKCYDAMNDDFNSPVLIAHLFEAVKQINLMKDGKASLTEEDLKTLKETLHAFVFDVLGLEDSVQSEGDSNKLAGIVNMLIELRNEARANKDWALSDKIRDDLQKLGVQLKDGKEGTTFTLN